MKDNFNIFLILISILLNFGLKAQNSVLTFQEILNKGFENNYNIKLERLSLDKSNYTLLRANGFLNPYLDTKIVYGEGADPTISNDGTKYIQTNFTVPTKFGVDFYTGVRLERTTEVDTPNYLFNSSGAYAGIKIPLLKGLGKTNSGNSFIEISKINQKALGAQFSNEILTYFNELLINYLSLKKVIEEYRIQKNIVDESKKYKNQIYTLADNDQIPLVEKNRANSFFNNKLQQLTISNIQVLQVYYKTKILLGINDNENTDSIPKLMDQVPDPNKEKLIEFITEKRFTLDTLIKNTPQYESIALGVDENKISLNNAKNQKRNVLDLNIRVSRFGSNENEVYNLDSTFNANPGTSVLVSLTHNLPIKNQSQKSAYLEQVVNYDLSKTSLQQYLFESTTSVELNLVLLKQKIDLFEQTKELAGLMKQSYQDEIDKFKLGKSTQTDLIISLNNYFKTLKALNLLKYDIWIIYVGINFNLGELPQNAEELNDFLFSDFF